jgi:hypothetical protein
MSVQKESQVPYLRDPVKWYVVRGRALGASPLVLVLALGELLGVSYTRHERLTRVGAEEDVEVVAGYGWDRTENRDGTLGGVEQHERNDDEPEPAADASGFRAAR